jgi:hypothetical protein
MLYAIGGADGSGAALATLEQASINASGDIGMFADAGAALIAPGRELYATVVIGNSVYIMGGYYAGTPPNFTDAKSFDTIEAATILADGSVGPFSDQAPLKLTVGRFAPTAVVAGNYVHVIGGSDVNHTVESALINPDGSLGAFGTSSSHLIAPRIHHVSVVVGNRLYVVGGEDYTTSNVLNTVEAATINPDGTLTAFATVSGVTLIRGRKADTAAVVGGSVYAIGGTDGTVDPGTLESATIGLGFSLQTFNNTTISLMSAGHCSAMVGSSLLIIAGYQSNGIERAQVDATGALGSFTMLAPTIAVARSASSCLVLGNFLYVFGGFDGDTQTEALMAARAPLQ